MVVPRKIRSAESGRTQNDSTVVRDPRDREICSIHVAAESLATSLNRVVGRHALPVLKHRSDKDIDIAGAIGYQIDLHRVSMSNRRLTPEFSGGTVTP
jgi:hypothetical protein